MAAGTMGVLLTDIALVSEQVVSISGCLLREYLLNELMNNGNFIAFPDEYLPST